MSRKFSNVLVICALVCVLALLITGTTLAVYNSISNTVNVYTVFVGDEKDVNSTETNSYANVTCGDVTGEDISVSKAHTQTATITAEYDSNAYTFVGWFVGDEAAYKAAVAEGTAEIVSGTSYEVSMDENSSLCAVYKVTKYTVSYSYTELDGSAVSTEAATVNYGAELEALAGNTEYDFVGWTATADGAAEALSGKFFYATFGSAGSVVLTDPYELHDYTTTEVTATIAVVDEENTATEDAAYTTTAATFKLQATDELANIFNLTNWTVKYSFWTLENVALSYNGTTYASTELYELAYAILTNANEISTTYSNVTINVVPTITKYFSNITFTNSTLGLNAIYLSDDLTSRGEEYVNNTLANPSAYDETVLDGTGFTASEIVGTTDSSSAISAIYNNNTYYTTPYVDTYNLSLYMIGLKGESTFYVLVESVEGTTINDLIEYLYTNVWTTSAYANSTDINEVVSYLNTNGYAESDGMTLTFTACNLYFVTTDLYVA